MSSAVLTALLRLVVAALVVAAIVATLTAVWPVSVFDFFGYFTVQGNVIGAVVAVVGAVRLLRGTPPSTAWMVVRWCTATYLVMVGVVFWALLAPLNAAGGIPLAWANITLHAIAPLAALLDLLLAPDRFRPALRLLPLVLVYPFVWTAVVLVRGATDGWVPYPFLYPSQGYGVVAAWAALVAGIFVGVAVLSRLPLGAGPRMSGPGRRGHGPREAVQRPDGASRRLLHDRARRDVRPARPERCWQVDDDRDPRGLPEALRRRGARARRRPRHGRARLEGADRRRAAVEHGGRHRDDAGAARARRLLLPGAAPRRRDPQARSG